SGIHALYALNGLGFFEAASDEGMSLLGKMLGHASPGHRRAALALWPAERDCPFDPLKEPDPFVVREWLLLAARMPADEGLGRNLRDWHRDAQRLRRGVVLDRC